MNRALSFGIAALQALIILSAVVGLVLVPLTLAWLIEGDGSVDWPVTLAVAGYAFLLAVGVPVQIASGELVGIAFDTFAISFLPLGLTLVMALMIIRIGHRLSAASSLWPAWLGGALTFGASSYALSLIISNPAVSLGEWDPLFRPALFFGGLLFISSVSGKRFELVSGANQIEAPERIWVRQKTSDFVSKLHWIVSTSAMPALRIGGFVIISLLLVSSVLITFSLAIGWVEVLRLYQALSLSFLGGLMVTLGQLAILPNLIIFGAAWISGAGFSIGAGSFVSPLASQLGPLPALPIFAALPTGGIERGIVFAVIPVVAAIIATLLARKSTERMRWEFATSFSAATVLGIFSALVAATLAFVLAILASGGLGPGRFAEVGIIPGLFAVVIFFEVLVPVFLVSLFAIRPQGTERK
ncbi:MAG: hypothetical protein F2536_01410 [Actinobacteria bacterium]|uniref:Unannotated protein n=1 Tax=freshwater metagenome TaxID=449393 RepID=A0A6J6BRY3_9ZZZZ|nr:hypothetical protein [Actinomycetota bacterium]